MSDAMWTALRASFETVPAKQRRTALAELREEFLAGTPPADYLSDKPTRAAYEEFFFPQSYEKARSVLAEVTLTNPQPRLLDLGSAMGPLGFAALERWPQGSLTLLDHSPGAMVAAKDLGKRLGYQITTIQGSFVDAIPDSKFDLVMLGNALLEVDDATADAVVEKLFAQHVSETLLIIEPADRMHARRLQALRDRWRSKNRFAVRPCPHDQGCPAQTRDRDFCHEARAAVMPEFFLEASADVGLSDSRLRFSYLIYNTAPAAVRDDQLVRIISHPIKEKGRLRYFGCSQTGLVEVMRQDRLRSKANAAFDHLGRGALIRVSAPQERIKLTEQTVVELVREQDPSAGG